MNHEQTALNQIATSLMMTAMMTAIATTNKSRETGLSE